MSIVPHQTTNGKDDRILNSINNSVLSGAHDSITFPNISNLEKPNISSKFVNEAVVQKGDKLVTIGNPGIKDEIKISVITLQFLR